MLSAKSFRASRLAATLLIAASATLVVSANALPAKMAPQAPPLTLVAGAEPNPISFGTAPGPLPMTASASAPAEARIQPAIVTTATEPAVETDEGPLTPQKLFQEICAAGIEHPEIVMRQALLETGNLKGRMLMSRNNLFGFRSQSYLSFGSWRESVAYYKKWQAKRYVNRGEDYFAFLTRIRYASGPSYKGFVQSQQWADTCPAKTV